MGRALSRRALRAVFAKMRSKRLGSQPPATVGELSKAYKLPKVRISGPKKPVPASKIKPKPAPKKSKRPRKQQPAPPIKQEIVIKVETPQAAKPKSSKPRKPRKPKTEAPKFEGAAKEASEKKTRRERFIEGAETVGAGETYAQAASGLFGFIKKRKKVIKAGAKRAGTVSAEGAIAGGAGTAVYSVATRKEEKKKKRKKKEAS